MELISCQLASNVDSTNGAFMLTTAATTIRASHVVLATGVVDKAPAIANLRNLRPEVSDCAPSATPRRLRATGSLWPVRRSSLSKRRCS